MEGTFRFVENKVIGTSADDGDGLSGGFGGYAGDFDGTGAGRGYFFDKAGGTKFVFGKVFDVCDWFAAGTLDSSKLGISLPVGTSYFADKLNLITFNILDAHDVHFLEEMKGINVDCISQDGFLYQ